MFCQCSPVSTVISAHCGGREGSVIMATDKRDKATEEEQIEVELEDEGFDRPEGDLPVAEDAIVEVAFGDPDDEDEDIDRTLCWVESFAPGALRREVADLLMVDGNIRIVLDKVTVAVPMMELFRLLEKIDLFKSEEQAP